MVVTKHKLRCPECSDGWLVLRDSRFGLFYGCSNYPECTASCGAHSNGEPLGIPGDKETRQARIKAHEEFDKLWKTGETSRHAAYRILQKLMDMTPEEAHIGRFSKAQCELLIKLLRKRTSNA